MAENFVNVRYMVDDVDAAVEFYTTRLDFKLSSPASPAFADVLLGNLRLLLSGPKSSAGRPMPDGHQPRPGGWNRIHLLVDDITAEVTRLRAAGVTFRNDIVTGPGGSQILVEDPSGNPIELFQPAVPTASAGVAVLTTRRLILREMTGADLDDMAALLGDAEVMRYYPAPKSRDEARAWIDWNQRLYRERGFGLWAVILSATGEFVGDCGLTPQHVDGAAEIELGYHIRARLQGKGYATEAAAACRDFARNTLGLHRLIAIIDPDNIPSQRVAAKIGLKPEKCATVFGSEQVIYATSI